MMGRFGRLRPATVVALAMTAVLSACEKPHFDPPDRAAQVEEADESFSMTLFDSIPWPSDSIRALEGNVVYSSYCRNCHGTLGRGETDYAEERGLEVPSIVMVSMPSPLVTLGSRRLRGTPISEDWPTP